MNQRILNREGKLPNDGYYQIETVGEHVNHRAKVVQVIDAKALESIRNRFAKEAAAENFAGQRLDKDHLSNDEKNPTEAMGWNKEVISREDGLYAQVKWTPLGRPLIQPQNPEDEPAYKFFSTEYEPDECEKLGTRKIGNRTYAVIRPLRLAGLSLTNDPNNRGQRPISNRGGNDAGAADENQPTRTMKKVNTLLGLAEDASEESAVAAIQLIQNRATKAEGHVTTLTKERDELVTAQVEADLEKYKNRFKPELREKWKAQLIQNRAATVELLESIPAGKVESPNRITNRGSATPPAADALTEEQKQQQADEARAAKITNRARALRSSDPKLSLSKSYELAEAEFQEGAS